MGALEQAFAFSCFVGLELAVFIAAVFGVLVQAGHRRAGALSLAVVLVLAAFSLALQALFLAGAIRHLPWLEAAGWGYGLYRIGRHRAMLVEAARDLFRLMRTHPVWSAVIALCLLYLGLQAFLLPPRNVDSMAYNLARVLLWQQEQTLFLTAYTDYLQVAFPVGGDILFHLFLRRHTDFGVGMFSFLAYLSIGAGVFQIVAASYARRIAALSAFAVMSLPELVLQATSTKPDLLVAAVAIALLVLADRILRAPARQDALLAAFLLLFGASIKMTFAAFAVPFVIFLSFAVWRAHGWNGVGALMRGNPARWLMLFPPALVFSQIWLYWHSVSLFGDIQGPPEFVAVHRNHDGIAGMAANLVKYGLQSIHLLEPVDWLVERGSGYSIPVLLTQAYENFFVAAWGDLGRSPMYFSFRVNWLPHDQWSWFGPLGAFAVFPAIVHCLFRGRGIFRLVSFLCVAYALIVAYQLAWMPWNSRFFSPFFAAGCLCLAPALDRWQSRPAEYLLAGVTLLVFLYSVGFNRTKPLVTFAQNQGNIWTATSFGLNREFRYQGPYGDRRIEIYASSVRRGARVAVFCRARCQIYPVLFKRPDVRVDARAPEHLGAGGRLDLGPADYLFCLDDFCNGVQGANGKVLWRSGPESRKRGELIELRKPAAR